MAEDSYIDVARQRRTVNKLKALIDEKANKGDSKTVVISPTNADKLTDDEATTLIDNWPNVAILHSNYYYYPAFYINGTYNFSRSFTTALDIDNNHIEYLPKIGSLYVRVDQGTKNIVVNETELGVATSTELGFVSIDNMSIGYIVDNQIGVKPSGINASKLANGAVETAKIRDSAITTAKLADGSVTKAKLGSDVVIPDAVSKYLLFGFRVSKSLDSWSATDNLSGTLEWISPYVGTTSGDNLTDNTLAADMIWNQGYIPAVALMDDTSTMYLGVDLVTSYGAYFSGCYRHHSGDPVNSLTHFDYCAIMNLNIGKAPTLKARCSVVSSNSGITADQLKTILASAYVADDGTVHFTMD